MNKLNEEWEEVLRLLDIYGQKELLNLYIELHRKYRDALKQLNVGQSTYSPETFTINGKNGFLINTESFEKGYKKALDHIYNYCCIYGEGISFYQLLNEIAEQKMKWEEKL